MSRTVICICLLLFAIGLPVADADEYPFTHNLALNTHTLKSSFLTTRFYISDPTLKIHELFGDYSELTHGTLLNNRKIGIQGASLNFHLPKDVTIGLGFKENFEKNNTFGENLQSTESWDIQASRNTESGIIFAQAQKIMQNSAMQEFTPASPAEKIKTETFDIYSVGFNTDIGALNITPQVSYTSDAPVPENLRDKPAKSTLLLFAIAGELDTVGFESELAYGNVEFSDTLNPSETSLNNTNLYGIYGNVWTNLDLNKIGMLFAYGNWDDNTRQGYDFTSNHNFSLFSKQKMPMILDTTSLNTWGSGLSGLVLGRLYGELTVGDNLFLIPSLTYLTDHVEGVKAVGYEINLEADYNITDILTYSAVVAFAETETVSDTSDPVISLDYKFLQSLQLKF